MTLRHATRYLLWYGDAAINGHTPTAEEYQKFLDARQVSIEFAGKMLRIKPDEITYRPGVPFE